MPKKSTAAVVDAANAGDEESGDVFVSYNPELVKEAPHVCPGCNKPVWTWRNRTGLCWDCEHPNAKPPSHPAAVWTAGETRIANLPTGSIQPSPYQVRSDFDEQQLQDLAASLKQHGLLQPITVRKVAGGYELIAGERRLRAARLAGLETIPAVIRECTDDQAAELCLLENLQRQDLNPIEEARGYRLLSDRGMTQTEIGERVGRSQSAIANAMRLLKLPEPVRKKISDGELTARHGLNLLTFGDHPQVVTAIAAYAAENKLPAQRLDTGEWSIWHQVEGKKLAKQINRWETLFDYEVVCGACPYGAYIGGRCLRPEHYEELQEEGRKKQEEALNAKAGDQPGAMVDLKQLGWGNWRECSDPPEGCSEECACRRRAMRGGQLIQVCVEPKRYQRLEGASGRARKKAQRTEAIQRADAAAARLQEPGQTVRVDVRQLVLMAWEALKHRGSERVKELSTAVAGTSLDHPEGMKVLFDHSWGVLSKRLEWLAAADPRDLAPVVADFVLRDEAWVHAEYGNGNCYATAWVESVPVEGTPGEEPDAASGEVITIEPEELRAMAEVIRSTTQERDALKKQLADAQKQVGIHQTHANEQHARADKLQTELQQLRSDLLGRRTRPPAPSTASGMEQIVDTCRVCKRTVTREHSPWNAADICLKCERELSDQQDRAFKASSPSTNGRHPLAEKLLAALKARGGEAPINDLARDLGTTRRSIQMHDLLMDVTNARLVIVASDRLVLTQEGAAELNGNGHSEEVPA